MESHFATVWESIADEIGDSPCHHHGGGDMKGTIGLCADNIDRLTTTLIHLGRHELDGRGRPISSIKDNRLSGRRHLQKA